MRLKIIPRNMPAKFDIKPASHRLCSPPGESFSRGRRSNYIPPFRNFRNYVLVKASGACQPAVNEKLGKGTQTKDLPQELVFTRGPNALRHDLSATKVKGFHVLPSTSYLRPEKKSVSTLKQPWDEQKNGRTNKVCQDFDSSKGDSTIKDEVLSPSLWMTVRSSGDGQFPSRQICSTPVGGDSPKCHFSNGELNETAIQNIVRKYQRPRHCISPKIPKYLICCCPLRVENSRSVIEITECNKDDLARIRNVAGQRDGNQVDSSGTKEISSLSAEGFQETDLKTLDSCCFEKHPDAEKELQEVCKTTDDFLEIAQDDGFLEQHYKHDDSESPNSDETSILDCSSYFQSTSEEDPSGCESQDTYTIHSDDDSVHKSSSNSSSVDLPDLYESKDYFSSEDSSDPRCSVCKVIKRCETLCDIILKYHRERSDRGIIFESFQEERSASEVKDFGLDLLKESKNLICCCPLRDENSRFFEEITECNTDDLARIRKVAGQKDGNQVDSSGTRGIGSLSAEGLQETDLKALGSFRFEKYPDAEKELQEVCKTTDDFLEIAQDDDFLKQHYKHDDSECPNSDETSTLDCPSDFQFTSEEDPSGWESEGTHTIHSDDDSLDKSSGNSSSKNSPGSYESKDHLSFSDSSDSRYSVLRGAVTRCEISCDNIQKYVKEMADRSTVFESFQDERSSSEGEDFGLDLLKESNNLICCCCPSRVGNSRSLNEIIECNTDDLSRIRNVPGQGDRNQVDSCGTRGISSLSAEGLQGTDLKALGSFWFEKYPDAEKELQEVFKITDDFLELAQDFSEGHYKHDSESSNSDETSILDCSSDFQFTSEDDPSGCESQDTCTIHSDDDSLNKSSSDSSSKNSSDSYESKDYLSSEDSSDSSVRKAVRRCEISCDNIQKYLREMSDSGAIFESFRDERSASEGDDFDLGLLKESKNLKKLDKSLDEFNHSLTSFLDQNHLWEDCRHEDLRITEENNLKDEFAAEREDSESDETVLSFKVDPGHSATLQIESSSSGFHRVICRDTDMASGKEMESETKIQTRKITYNFYT